MAAAVGGLSAEPARFPRAGAGARLAALPLSGLAGAFAPWIAGIVHLVVPVVAALHVRVDGPHRFAEEAVPRMAEGLSWLFALGAWSGTVTDRFPTSRADLAARLIVAPVVRPGATRAGPLAHRAPGCARRDDPRPRAGARLARRARRSDRISRRFAALVRETGLPRLSIHSLCHSYATAALAVGVHVRTLAARLGHDPAVMLRVYQHAVPALEEHAAEKVAALLFKG